MRIGRNTGGDESIGSIGAQGWRSGRGACGTGVNDVWALYRRT